MGNNYVWTKPGKRAFWWILLLWVYLGAPHGARAQYMFTAVQGTFTPLVGASPVAAVQADEGVSGLLPIGFTFMYDKQLFTQFTASSNGWLDFTRTGSTSPNPSQSLSWGGPVVAPLWANLSGVGGTASYQTSGTAPNRVFTFEWLNWRWDYRATQAGLSFQVKLYEGSNRIEFIYRQESGALNLGPGLSPPAIGLGGLYSNGSVTSYELSDASTAPSVNTGTSTINAKPATGQTYRFTPGAFTCPRVQSTRLIRARGTTATIGWGTFVPDGTVTVFYGLQGFTPGGAGSQQLTGISADSAVLTGLEPNLMYDCYVQQYCDGANAATRGPVFTFRAALRPTNDEGSSAMELPIVATYERRVIRELTNATESIPPVGNCGLGGTTARDIWFSFTATRTEHSVLFSNATPGLVVDVRNGWNGTSQSRACLTATGSSSVTPNELRLPNLVVGRKYYLRAYDSRPVPTLQRVELCVGPSLDAPVNDECAAAIPVLIGTNGSQAVTGSVFQATRSGGNITACNVGTGSRLTDMWYKFTTPATGPTYSYDVWLETGGFVGVLQGLTDCGPNATAWGCSTADSRQPGRLRLVNVAPGTTTYLMVSTTVPAPIYDPTFRLYVNQLPLTPPANDDCGNAQPLSIVASHDVPTDGTLLGATVSAVGPVSGCGSATYFSADAWYQFTATATTHVLDFNPRFPAILDVRSGNCTTSTSIACQGVAADAVVRQVLNNLVVGTTYLVRVYPAQQPLGTNVEAIPAPTFKLKVTNLVTAPVNDEPAGAISVAVGTDCSLPMLGTMDGATASWPPNGSQVSRDLWYTFVATATRLRVELARGPNVGCTILASTTAGSLPVSNTALVVGQRYYLRVYDYSNTALLLRPAFRLCVSTMYLNDEPCTAMPLPISAGGACQPVRGNTYDATSSIGNGLTLPLANCSGVVTNSVRDLWYTLTPTTRALTVTCNDTTVELLRLYTASSCGGLMRIVGCQASPTIPGTFTSMGAIGTVHFDDLTPGQTYYLAASDDNRFMGAFGYFTLCAQTALTTPTRAAAAAAISVYPNPVPDGQLHLQIRGNAAAQPARLELRSTLGQLVRTRQWTARAGTDEQLLTTTGLSRGLYLLRVWVGGQPSVHRVLIE